MSEHVYKVVDLVGTSEKGVKEAVENAVARASETIRNIRWFEASQIRGSVEGNRITHYQVAVRIGFTIED